MRNQFVSHQLTAFARDARRLPPCSGLWRGRRKNGIREYGNTGILEYRNDGITKCRKNGIFGKGRQTRRTVQGTKTGKHKKRKQALARISRISRYNKEKKTQKCSKPPAPEAESGKPSRHAFPDFTSCAPCCRTRPAQQDRFQQGQKSIIHRFPGLTGL